MFIPVIEQTYLYLTLVSCGYLLSYAISYYIYKQNMLRLWQHLEQVIRINDTTYELVNLSSQYDSEKSFLDALLEKAVSAVDDAEMGSIILVDELTHQLQFVSVIGLNIDILQKVDFTLEETFLYRLTEGRFHKTVIISNINAKSAKNDDRFVLPDASDQPICSTLSSPIKIEGKLYGMMSLDSTKAGAFGDYDISLANILTSEAANAISLYQKSKVIENLANCDGLTELYNRKKFDAAAQQWRHDPQLASYIVIIDMDNLKPLNDEFGHLTGDYALKTLAKSLKSMWHPQFLVARYGGDEFVALCHGRIEVLTQQIIQMQDALIQFTPAIHFSYGIARYEQDLESAFKQADNKMYSQKKLKKQY
ncbi:GGDEF domain-containing protein [Shewanella aestuarii]|nr:GGDEF domain-containing protein [Shewanella aestuarii]